MSEMNRATFLRVVALLIGGAVVGCDAADDAEDGGGGGDGGSGDGGSGAANSGGTGPGGGEPASCDSVVDAQITCREGHSLVIPVEDLVAAQTRTYDIRGTNPTHGHDVTVTAEMFAQLLAGEEVEIYVPSAVLPHTVFIKCEGLDPGALDQVDC